MPSATRYYHPDYRHDEVARIVGALDQGLSVSLVGPPSIGKSNLLQFLDQDRLAPNDASSPWLRDAPNARTAGPLLAIPIDPNALLPALPEERGAAAAAAWPGFELLVHRTTITRALYPDVLGGQPATEALATRLARLQRQFESAHDDITAMEDHLHAHLALRHLENILDAVFTSFAIQNSPLRVVYFMDEFERLLNVMPDYFFVALRSIRDRFKYQVMFVTLTRSSLPTLIGEGERVLALEPFVELFHDATIYLGPFADDDAWRMVEQLENRSVSKDDHALGLLIRATGGFAGLLRAGFKHAEGLQPIPAQPYAQAVTLAATRLAAEANVQAECQTLLRGLSQEEIAALFAVALGTDGAAPDVVRELVHKSLLAQTGQGVRVHPPVLGIYVRNHPNPPTPRPSARPVTLPR